MRLWTITIGAACWAYVLASIGAGFTACLGVDGSAQPAAPQTDESVPNGDTAPLFRPVLRDAGLGE